MKISVFGEGPTEEQVHSKLAKLIGLIDHSKYFSSKGKGNLNAKVIETIGADLGVRPVRCLVIRDLDTHDGEDKQSICQSITDALQKELATRSSISFQFSVNPHPSYPNIYTLEIAEIDFRLAIHIATYQWSTHFINSTTDDYLLALALRQNTVTNLSTKRGITPERLGSSDLSVKRVSTDTLFTPPTSLIG